MSGVKINQVFNPIVGKDSVPASEFNKLVGQLNAMKRDLERCLSPESVSILVTQALSSGSSGGGGSTGSTVQSVTKSVTGGVAYAEVFDAPSLLLTLPISYVTVDGMMSFEFPKLESLTVNGFTITPLQDGQVIYSYVNI